MENPGGVLTSNQLPESVITFLDDNKIIGNEEIIAYYDYTITLNNSESAILTNKNIIYYKSGRTERIPLDSIKSIMLEKGYVFLNNDRQRREIEVVVASFLATYDQV